MRTFSQVAVVLHHDDVIITVNGGTFLVIRVYLPFVGLFVNMIRRRASTINEDVNITVLGDLSEDSFSHRRAAYVTQAYDENFRFHGR